MIIGLTGNIGSGKSVVAKYLAGLGAETVDTDSLAREAAGPGTEGLKRICREFSPDVLDARGRLDRAKMAAIVFTEPQARKKLEAILHPEIIKLTKARINAYRQSKSPAPALVVEAPLLIEADMRDLVDEVWVVTVNPDTQIERVMARNGISRQETLNRINAQMSQDEKLRYADRIIDNSGPVEATQKQIDAIWVELAAKNFQAVPENV